MGGVVRRCGTPGFSKAPFENLPIDDNSVDLAVAGIEPRAHLHETTSVNK